MSLLASHLEAWTTICSPLDLGPDAKKVNLKWRWSPEHLSPATAGFSVPCVLGLSPAGSSTEEGVARRDIPILKGKSGLFGSQLQIFQLTCCVIQLMGGHKHLNRPRWSSSYRTRLWIRGSRVPSRPGSMDFSQRKHHEYDFLRKGRKVVGPLS